MTIAVFAPAKINLTLEVGRPRADGLHPLQSVVVFADVGDTIEAEPAASLSLEITGRFGDALLSTESNLVFRAALALQAAARVSRGAALRLTKNLPIASGIGGGSSDAAATLRALNALWSLGLSLDRLAEIARPLGADAPVCVAARSAYMTGAGESYEPIELPSIDAVLINPLMPLPTADVYRCFDDMALGDTFVSAPAPPWRNLADVLTGIAALGNDLAIPAHTLAPILDDIAALLRADARVRVAGLSGSGATMFALVDGAQTAAALASELAAAHPAWWVRACKLGGPLDGLQPRG